MTLLQPRMSKTSSTALALDETAGFVDPLPKRMSPILSAQKNTDDLSKIERVMLACDGTFTFQLEALFEELIKIELLHYQTAPIAGKTAALLDVGEGTKIWERKTLLRGKQTNTPYIYAHSFVNDQYFPDTFNDDLKSRRCGIGNLFAEYKMSTYRRLVGYYIETSPDYINYFTDMARFDFLCRVYTICYQHKSVMLIIEKMPRAKFAA